MQYKKDLIQSKSVHMGKVYTYVHLPSKAKVVLFENLSIFPFAYR